MSRALTSIREKIKFFGEIWSFLRSRKKWWLTPIIIFLFLFGVIMIFAEGSAFAPIIYTLF